MNQSTVTHTEAHAGGTRDVERHAGGRVDTEQFMVVQTAAHSAVSTTRQALQGGTTEMEQSSEWRQVRQFEQSSQRTEGVASKQDKKHSGGGRRDVEQVQARSHADERETVNMSGDRTTRNDTQTTVTNQRTRTVHYHYYDMTTR